GRQEQSRRVAAPAWRERPSGTGSGTRQGHTPLPLIFATTITIRGFANIIPTQEQHLGTTLAGVDLGRQRRGVGELQCNVALPLGLQRRHVDDDAAAGIGAFAEADREHLARNAKVLHRPRQRERIGRDDADIAHKIHEGFLVERLGIDDGRVDIGEYLEFVRAADVVAIAAGAITDDTPAVHAAHLVRFEGLDHAALGRYADPAITLDAHTPSLQENY